MDKQHPHRDIDEPRIEPMASPDSRRKKLVKRIESGNQN